jgi:hypothetical protein
MATTAIKRATPTAHAASHTTGNDQIADATTGSHGLMTASQVELLLAKADLVGGIVPTEQLPLATPNSPGAESEADYQSMHGVPATATATCAAQASYSNGQTFVVSDGTHAATTFEMYSADPFTPHGAGYVAVDIRATGTGAPGASTAASVATLRAAAIAAVGSNLAVTVSVNGSVITLIQKTGGTQGNVALSGTVQSAGETLVGFAGGITPLTTIASNYASGERGYIPIATYTLGSDSAAFPDFAVANFRKDCFIASFEGNAAAGKTLTLEVQPDGTVAGSGSAPTCLEHAQGASYAAPAVRTYCRVSDTGAQTLPLCFEIKMRGPTGGTRLHYESWVEDEGASAYRFFLGSFIQPVTFMRFTEHYGASGNTIKAGSILTLWGIPL